ncbi:hypothetical protein CAPTEDRAFT_200375 [Capitella teleta]|uniref:Uncharacterized protein n=1 Tax=Capitella teleta TaxID=283909 RepID=R7UTM5_CAPTE|nr:hypothetical protein CAPTEDRAFT_200375 [Capitella teleta]|eukprot:ELU09503.1 hypothetical protein CAPTEDRAFT_200375 [Capitella teleta]
MTTNGSKTHPNDKANNVQMKAELNDHQWPHPSEMDINNLNDHLRTTLIDIQEKYVSSKGISGPRKHKPYQVTLEDQKVIKYKHKTWKKYSQTETSPKNFKEYTRARNKVTKIIRRAERDTESNICSKVETNPKLFWKFIKSKTKPGDKIPDLKTKIGLTNTDQAKRP